MRYQKASECKQTPVTIALSHVRSLRQEKRYLITEEALIQRKLDIIYRWRDKKN